MELNSWKGGAHLKLETSNALQVCCIWGWERIWSWRLHLRSIGRLSNIIQTGTSNALPYRIYHGATQLKGWSAFEAGDFKCASSALHLWLRAHLKLETSLALHWKHIWSLINIIQTGTSNALPYRIYHGATQLKGWSAFEAGDFICTPWKRI